ncbi:MAG TPA: glycoside hydrolase family 38 C-terminal domain-containing protein, partial [Gemmatimonadaceae bacterium]|nr:glycoside hydrolase family 38 C-terminal domain-containing protein [Gemmatimonadaceae bacterium]
LYCPDSFGHPAALPAIAEGFGLRLIVLWRGYGSSRWPKGDTFRWIAPSGDEALVYHLPRDGYEFGSHLPSENAAAAARWERIHDELAPRSSTGIVLVPNGADHHARQRHYREAIDAIQRASAPDRAHRSSLRAFAAAVTAHADGKLPVVEGELRDSYGFTWALQGTFAARAHEKRRNARVERALVRDAEPWAALAARKGYDARALTNHAWQTLLQAHPHDTLCGCSIDAVAVAMEERLRSAANQASGIRQTAIAALIGHDADRARESAAHWRPIVLLRNRAVRRRSGVARVEIEEFISHVPVGPGSAREPDAHVSRLSHRVPRVPSLGKLQVLSRSSRYSRTESARHYPDNDLVAVTEALAWVDDTPPYGIEAHAIGDGATRLAELPEPVRVEANAVSNGRLVVAVSDGGVITLRDEQGEREISDLVAFVDDADVGDLYTAAPRPRKCDVRFLGARQVHRGPLRGELALRFRVREASRRQARSVADLILRVSLDAGAPFVRLSIDGDNHDRDHRLRVLVRHDVRDGDVWADAAFGPVHRTPIVPTNEECEMETAPPTAPLHRYVTVADDERGVTLVSDGLAEYESRDDAIAVTLVRAVGELSRNDLPERPGHAGWPTPTPGAQCIGPFAASFAVYLHGRRDAATIDAIEHVADDVLLPIRGETLRSALDLPSPVIGPALEGQGLAVGAIKQSESGPWLVLRCINLTDETVYGLWRLPFTPVAASLARLDETPTEQIRASAFGVAFVATPRATVTILVC